MEKLHTSLLSLALVAGITAPAEAKVYLGAGVGYTCAKAPSIGTTSVSSTTARNGSSGHSTSGAGGAIDAHVGHLTHLNPDWFRFEQLAIAFDTAKATKRRTIANLDAKQTVDRMYNISGALGLGYTLYPTWTVHGKVGIANAALRFKHSDPQNNFSKTANRWGTLIGVGFNKSYTDFAVGFDYEYTHYQARKMEFGSANWAQYSTKIKCPSYHTIMLKVSKTF